MKTAVWILAFVSIALAIFAFMQWQTIKKLTPAPAPDANGTGTMRFGDMVSDFQKQAKVIEVKATY